MFFPPENDPEEIAKAKRDKILVEQQKIESAIIQTRAKLSVFIQKMKELGLESKMRVILSDKYAGADIESWKSGANAQELNTRLLSYKGTSIRKALDYQATDDSTVQQLLIDYLS
jgi:hypothetical protein